MSLCTEDVLHIIGVDGVVRVEQKVEILYSLGQEEALLSVFQALVVDIMDGSISTPAENRYNIKLGSSIRRHRIVACLVVILLTSPWCDC